MSPRPPLPLLPELRFGHAGWLIVVVLGEHTSVLANASADLSRQGTHRCRVSAFGFRGNDADAIASLTRAARSAIDDMVRRDTAASVKRRAAGGLARMFFAGLDLIRGR